MDNSSQNQLITEIQDPTPAAEPTTTVSNAQQSDVTPLAQNPSLNGITLDSSASQVPVANTSNTASPMRQKLLEEFRLAIRDISQKVVEAQLPLRETITKVQERMSQGITSTSTQNTQTGMAPQVLTEISQSTPLSSTIKEESLSSNPQQEVASSYSLPTQTFVNIGVTPAAIPEIKNESLQQEAPTEATLVDASPQTTQSTDVSKYTEALHTLSETGVNLLKGIVELDRKQPGPEPTAPLTTHTVITDQDLVEFLLNENNDAKLKDFGDLKVIRKIIREKLGLPTDVANTMQATSAPESVQSITPEPAQTVEATQVMPQTQVPPESTETQSPLQENEIIPEQMQEPKVSAQSTMPAVGSDSSPSPEEVPVLSVADQQPASSPISNPEKGSVMGFLSKLFKKSA